MIHDASHEQAGQFQGKQDSTLNTAIPRTHMEYKCSSCFPFFLVGDWGQKEEKNKSIASQQQIAFKLLMSQIVETYMYMCVYVVNLKIDFRWIVGKTEGMDICTCM